MGFIYTPVTVTGPSSTFNGYQSPYSAGTVSLVMQQPDDVTGPEREGKRWYRCQLCGLSFPRSKIVFFRGVPYGIPCTDYKDIRQLARRKDLSPSQKIRMGR